MTAVAALDLDELADEAVEPMRWPLGPLLDKCGLARSVMALHLGISGTTLRAAAQSGLTDEQADRWAVGLGFHPANVWGWDWVAAGHHPERLARTVPAWHPLAEALRTRIARGDLAAGDVIPTAADLAAATGLSQSGVHRALDLLRTEGLVVTRRGCRAVVAGDHPTEPALGVAEPHPLACSDAPAEAARP